MAMIIQHNMAAINTNRQLGISTNALAKSTEKLSSGYRINRAADDAAGLAISEKMRSQIRGLDRASINASEGISMIQTAEGALAETHAVLQRMRELSVQAANGTETEEDRSNIQDEIEQLQDELDRIAEDTEFNKIKLLDGSLSAGSAGRTEAGPKFGVYDTKLKAFITSNIAGAAVRVENSASSGGESAVWDETGRILTLNLAKNQTYTESELDDLIADARQEDSAADNAPARIELNLKFGSLTAGDEVTGGTAVTEAGVKAAADNVEITAVMGPNQPPVINTVYEAAIISYEADVIGDRLGDPYIRFYSNTPEYTVLMNSGADSGNTDSVVNYDSAAKRLTITIGSNYIGKDELQALVDTAMGGSFITVGSMMRLCGDSGTKTAAVKIDIPVQDYYFGENEKEGIRMSTGVPGGASVVIYAMDTVSVGDESSDWVDEEYIEKYMNLYISTQKAYTAAELNEIIKNKLDQTESPVSYVELHYEGVKSFPEIRDGVTIEAFTPGRDAGIPGAEGFIGADKISLTANRYGEDNNVSIRLTFDAEKGKEECAVINNAEYNPDGSLKTPGSYNLKLQTGREYTEEDIEAILAEAGLDMDVTLSGPDPDEPDTLFITDNSISVRLQLQGGKGLGDEDAFLGEDTYAVTAGGTGVILQIGANEGQTMSFSIDDMSASALGVTSSSVNVSTQAGASRALSRIDEAIAKVSRQRSLLGAVQNRLEHTISNLDNTAENLQSAESSIRDVDMASEMVVMSKYNILQQIGQAMLAQANQGTQGVLSLLQG